MPAGTMREKTGRGAFIGLVLGLLLSSQLDIGQTVSAEPGAETVERVVSLGSPRAFVTEDELEPEGRRRIEGGSVLLALPADWDRQGPLEIRLAWSVRDDFPIGEPAKPRVFARGASLGAGDHHHPEWLHPDEEDLAQEPMLEVERPDYSLDQGELVGHPYMGAVSTLAMATLVVDPAQIESKDEFMALYLEPEWSRWPMPGAVDGELLSLAHLRYVTR